MAVCLTQAHKSCFPEEKYVEFPSSVSGCGNPCSFAATLNCF